MFHYHYLCLTRGKALDEFLSEEKPFFIIVFIGGRVGYWNRFMLTAQVIDRTVTNQRETPRLEVLDVMNVGAVVPKGDETILNDVGSEVLIV